MSPELVNELETLYRKEKAMNNRIIHEKSCLMCKVVSGTLFLGMGAFHGYRVYGLWNNYPVREKIFNVAAIGFLMLISAANYNAAYQTYLGKTMQMIEYRPSILRRLTQGTMSPLEREAYLAR